jgi:hypothetical protein
MRAKTPARKIIKSKTGPKIKLAAHRRQDFDQAGAKRDAMAMLSSDLNTYKRGPTTSGEKRRAILTRRYFVPVSCTIPAACWLQQIGISEFESYSVNQAVRSLGKTPLLSRKAPTRGLYATR